MAGNESAGRQGLSLERFVQAKQNNPAVHRARKKKEFIRKANVVRNYKRLLKQEGFEAAEPSRGAKRPRTSDGPQGEAPPGDNKDGASKGREQRDKRQRKPKTNPYQDAKRQAEEREEAARLERENAEAREKERVSKQKERKAWTRKLTQRTRRGQPVLKHKIDHLLSKIERDMGKTPPKGP